jgi:hypothetical protein
MGPVETSEASKGDAQNYKRHPITHSIAAAAIMKNLKIWGGGGCCCPSSCADGQMNPAERPSDNKIKGPLKALAMFQRFCNIWLKYQSNSLKFIGNAHAHVTLLCTGICKQPQFKAVLQGPSQKTTPRMLVLFGVDGTYRKSPQPRGWPARKPPPGVE